MILVHAIHWKTKMGNRLPENFSGVCPHCSIEVDFQVVEALSSIAYIPLPRFKAFACPECGGFSRQEHWMHRFVNIAFLLPMLGITLCAFFAGIIAIPRAYTDGSWDGFAISAALFLIPISGLISWRLIRLLRINFDFDRLIPLSHSLTTEI